tara:strand:- start:101 stop:244 length:144 start_codon:yes stop_codon:yes gene_type:complete
MEEEKLVVFWDIPVIKSGFLMTKNNPGKPRIEIKDNIIKNFFNINLS